MRLAPFILENLEPLLVDWERFARGIPSAEGFDAVRLRDHAEQMLRSIAADLGKAQSPNQQFEKSEGRGQRGAADTAAELHGGLRYADGFSLIETLTEYRALRATVIRHWTAMAAPAGADEFEDLIRFNEAVDQTIMEASQRFEDEKAKVQRQLREQDQLFQIAVDAAYLGVWDLDLTTRTLSTRSLRHDQMFGYEDRQAEWSQARAEQHVLDEDRPAFRAAIEQALKSGKLAFEVRVRWPDATVHWIAAQGRTRLDSAGHPIAISGVIMDITARKESEQALITANRQKDEFLAMLAHELRNPLSAIANASEVLAHVLPGEPRIEKPVAILRRQMRQLTKLVDDLLDVARIARGRIALDKKPIPISDVIEQAVEMVQPALREKAHQLVLSRSQTPSYVSGDLYRLVQAVGNILHNASKYTPAGGKIELEVRDKGAELEIEVRDNGVGIPQELLPHVFDLFVQNRRTLDRAQGGLGIGLSVVKGLVSMHQGSVSAASAGVNQGTGVTIRLPTIAAPGIVASAADRAPTPRRRVLVVDDNVDAADTLKMLLELEGHEVHAVYGAEEALAMAQRLLPEVVFLDIGLPEMDGYEVARRLRATNAERPLQLIALTGYGQNNDKSRSMAAGFDVHLVKPVTLAVLADVVGRGASLN